MLALANIFAPLISIFEAILKFIHNDVGIASWGLSIVLLTIFIRALLLPLTVKQFHSMQRMQAHMPELKVIQNKYKEDKQRQQQEMMKFYKENNINPFGSCLPLVAQLPVFISLYYMLRTTLRADICPHLQPHHLVNGKSVIDTAKATVACGPHGGASFLFIPDLTNHATGVVLVVLIVLYVGTQLFSSLMMSTPTMDRTQRNIMLLMPLFFVVVIIGFPAGVILYWITTNTWTIGQQYVVKKRIGPIVPAVATATGDGGDGRARGSGGGGGGADGGGPNGTSGGGGLGALLRGGRPKPQPETAGVGARSAARTGPPPPSPRKKKKRSGRRR